MRSRGIQAGDVVQVVRDCCGVYLGTVYIVRTIEFISEPVFLHCAHCRYAMTATLAVWGAKDDHTRMRVAPIAWLRKLEPPAESIEEINRLWEPRRETIKVPVRATGKE